MFSSKTVARLALTANLVGTVALFYSFQATSSNFRYITTADRRSALCVDRYALIVVDPKQSGVALGQACPAWEDGKPAAVVSIEKPNLAIGGFLLNFLGFLIQALSIPSAKTERELRLEIKRLKAEEKSKKHPI